MTFEQLISQQRPHVDQVLQDLARRHHLAPQEVDEFRLMLDRALERNDYELLRAFDGRSTWETYLATVVTRLFFSFQDELWGKWRPTALARRLGPTAVLLEELVLRDRMAIDAAIDVMRGTHRVDVPPTRLESIAAQLGLHDDRAAASNRAHKDPAAHALNVQSALRDALALLSPDDRLILAMRFGDHQPLTRIGKVMKIEARPLQRRIEQAKEVIGTSLRTQGIAEEDIDVLLQHAETESSSPHRRWWTRVLPRP